MVNLPKKGETDVANVALRGVDPMGLVLRPEIRIIEGRMFQPAVHELIVGKSAQAQFAGLDVGQQISIRGSDWNIVGSFESNGDSHESEMLADVETVLSAYRRNLYQAVIVQLESVDSFEALKDSLTTNPALTVDVSRETEYYAAQSKELSAILFFVAYFVGGIMAVGAMFGALNTMYSAVSARTLEIATLRAIGFGAGAVVISIFVEAIMLALAGGVLGSVLAWAFFDGNVVSTLGGNFTQLVFPLTVTTGLVALGITWACGIGLIGASFPAIRAARLPVAAALAGAIADLRKPEACIPARPPPACPARRARWRPRRSRSRRPRYRSGTFSSRAPSEPLGFCGQAGMGHRETVVPAGLEPARRVAQQRRHRVAAAHEHAGEAELAAADIQHGIDRQCRGEPADQRRQSPAARGVTQIRDHAVTARMGDGVLDRAAVPSSGRPARAHSAAYIAMRPWPTVTFLLSMTVMRSGVRCCASPPCAKPAACR